MLAVLTPHDYMAVAWFLVAWLGFNILVEGTPLRRRTLSHAMEQYRRNWLITMTTRDVRIMDTSIISGLQQGTAFFASTALIAIGGSFALLESTDTIFRVAGDLDIPVEHSRAIWEIKVLGLMLILAYAFFKFGWAYRLFNYASIVMGAVPERSAGGADKSRETALKAAELIVIAGRHFNRGQRAFFFAVGFLGWFAGPEVFAATTLAVLLVLLRRQFLSKARAAVVSGQNWIPPEAGKMGAYTETGSSNPFTS
ncbi:membrane protein [Roseibium aquae]|uniref:Membrane protein n=1 Tax=Roseibium aquae TaxID=1323746 RepID=A0A916TLX6_9HYPH|nr:DUF599 family protein [Roseibium aquae]GGB58579.1 membrane protein [Roseibium aquae]